ncbi:MAG: DUF3108 domain-containing protein [Candidatus Omnitrophica bacterium]|nr:DUF3108 domain-containing protein [Candidatus Omnitrophota bacterium]
MSREDWFRLTVTLAVLTAASPAWGALRSDRWPSPKERGAYQVRIASTGKILWKVAWETTVTKQAGDNKQVEIHEQGEGQPLRYKEPVSWKKRMVFQAPSDSSIHPLQFQLVEGSRWNQGGKLISQLQIQADPEHQRILYQDSETGKTPQSAVFPWTPQMVPDELLFHWARTLPFGQGGECMLMVSPTQRIRMQAQMAGTERITTPAGTFSCYRVNLAPKLFGPLSRLAPRMSLWCTKDLPHYWVRYQGPVGGPGSPQAIIELVEFKEEGR